MQAEIKMENGELFAKRVDCAPWFRLPNKLRIANGLPITIEHWVNPQSYSAAFILDRIRMSMNRSRDCGRHEMIMMGRGHDNMPIIAQYDHPVMLVFPDFYSRSGLCQLLSPEGLLLAGSNIYWDGYGDMKGGQCLGGSCDPFNASAVELLTTNKANNDLNWVGDMIEGELKIDSEIGTCFHIKTWPTLTEEEFKWNPPHQIKESLDVLLRP